MRSEKEIRDKILELLDFENDLYSVGAVTKGELVDGEIYALRWVLGEREGL